MIAFLRTALFALFLVAPLSAHAQPAQFDDKAKAEIERIVHDYLVGNPEVLVKAFEELERRHDDAKLAQTRSALAEHAQALFSDPGDYVAGNPEGDVTIVEFFDYRCGYCKRSFEPLMDFVKKDGNVRLVLKEFPILGPASLEAAKAAMAAKKQGRYMEMHSGLYAHKGDLDAEAIDAIAKKAGVDVARMRKDMEDQAFADQVSRTYRLAEALGIEGTPAFVAGGTVYPGMADADRLAQMAAHARGD